MVRFSGELAARRGSAQSTTVHGKAVVEHDSIVARESCDPFVMNLVGYQVSDDERTDAVVTCSNVKPLPYLRSCKAV